MDISGSYTLNAPRVQVWDALFDPDTLKRAVPGCESLQKTGDNEYTARLTVEAAGIKGVYDSTLKTLDPQKPESFRLIVDGAGARGILHGDGTLRLEAQDAGATVVHYAGQAQLGGTIASIGMGVASHEATRLINDCFARLSRTLGAAVPVAAGAATDTAGAAAAATATPAAAPAAAPAAPTSAAPAAAPAPASDALAAPATPAAPHLESSLPRTAPITPPHMTPAPPTDADKALAMAATASAHTSASSAGSAGSAAAAAPMAAPANQQRPGWLQRLRRLLRLG